MSQFAADPRAAKPSHPRQATLRGIRNALGIPAVALGASYVGFGSLVRESGLHWGHGLLSTGAAWALPGQVVMVELYAVGASFLAITAAVALTNFRLLPMAIVLMPVLRAPGTPRWLLYLAAHLFAVTGWAVAMRDCPRMPPPARMPYFLGFAATLWTVTLAATAIGYLLAGGLPTPLALGLVFLNPIYFMLIFASDLRQRAKVLSLAFGAVAGPAFHLLDPDWGLLATGIVAGSLAFAADRLLPGGRQGRHAS